MYSFVNNMDSKYCRKILEEMGYPPIPSDFPKRILDSLFLNAGAIFRMKGSIRGLDYFIRAITRGLPEITYINPVQVNYYMIPSDLLLGYFTDSENYSYFFNGFNSSDTSLTIHVKTPYANLISLKTYLEKHIKKFILFIPDESQINITFEQDIHYRIPYNYQYFEDGYLKESEPVVIGTFDFNEFDFNGEDFN